MKDLTTKEKFEMFEHPKLKNSKQEEVYYNVMAHLLNSRLISNDEFLSLKNGIDFLISDLMKEEGI